MYPAITKNYAHIFETEIITDTTNWTTISGNFVADSAYQYLVIGNFFDDILTSHIKYFDNGYSECASYYYIDDVYVGIDTTVNANYYNMQNSIKIFPNPSSGVISVLLPVNNIPATLKTYNLFGKIVYEITLFDEETTIYYNEIPTGIYFIKVQTDNYNIVKKLLINKKY